MTKEERIEIEMLAEDAALAAVELAEAQRKKASRDAKLKECLRRLEAASVKVCAAVGQLQGT